MTTAYKNAWNTTKELAHIQGMGDKPRRLTDTLKAIPLEALLAGYLAGCERRTEWGDIDKKKVIAAAKERLAGLALEGRRAA